MQQINQADQGKSPFSFSPAKKETNHKAEQRRAGRRRRLGLLALFMLIFTFWAVSLWNGQKVTLQEKKEDLQVAQARLAEATEQQIELNYQINRLHDYDYIAEIARRDYFLSKPGELIFKVPN